MKRGLSVIGILGMLLFPVRAESPDLPEEVEFLKELMEISGDIT